MTAPIPSAPVAVPRWYGRPRTLLPVLLGVLVFTALLTPEPANRNLGDRRLTTHENTPAAASLAADLPRALGWRVDENTSVVVPPRPDMVHLVLAPSEPMRAAEVHALLERVRGGAGLYTILDNESGVLADSLNLGKGNAGALDSIADLGGHCPVRRTDRLPWLVRKARYRSLRWKAPPPGSVDTLLRIASWDTAHGPLIIGFAYGRGRIVAGADADLLRNDELRQCTTALGVPYIRALEYLRDSGAVTPRRWLVFDEYHQGFGPQPGTVRAVVTFFEETASGHVVAQFALAGLLLLFHKAPRLVPPAPDAPEERRSPVEHVDALARAYVQVGATRTATQRLMRGLRRRLDRGTARAATSLSDDGFLDRAEARRPTLAAPVRLVRQALAKGHAARDFSAVGDALATIEHTLRQDSR